MVCKYSFAVARKVALATIAVTAACTTTLDPTVSVGETEPGAFTTLAMCSLFQHENRQYTVCEEPLAHAAAAHDCSLRQATLAVIESEPENALVTGYAAEVVGTNVWLGATRDDDLVWKWENGRIFWIGGRDGSQESGAYVRWAPGEPNNSSTVSTDPERCLALTLDGADWNDRGCTLALSYICERELD